MEPPLDDPQKAHAALRQMQEITRFADAQKLGDFGTTYGGRSKNTT